MLEINASHMPLGNVQGLRRPDGVGQAPHAAKRTVALWPSSSLRWTTPMAL